jgi:uncharacterized membrane protein
VNVLDLVPVEAPIQSIIESRETWRNKVRAQQLLNCGSLAFITAISTINVSINPIATKAPYWLYAIAGTVAGAVLASAITRLRAVSPDRHRNAIERSWRRTRAWTAPRAERPWRVLVAIVALLVTSIAFIAFGFWAGLSHIYLLLLPLVGASLGASIVRVVRTFARVKWFGPGAFDVEIAAQLARSTVKARKIEYWAEVYAQQHPASGDATS